MKVSFTGHDVRRIASDPTAFEVFYRRHIESMRRYVTRRVDDPHLAADLIADIFLAAIDSANSYRSDLGDPTRWLFGVARNVVAAERRRNAREVRAGTRILGRALADDNDLADLIERIDAEAWSRRLYRAMDRLSGEDRDLLEMVALDGLSIREAGEVLGLKPVAARVRLHRTRQLLRTQLAHSGGTELSPRIALKEASS